MAVKCTSGKICNRCSDSVTHQADHKKCDNFKKCCNCSSSEHGASEHEKCPVYIKIMQKITSRAVDKTLTGCHHDIDVMEL